MTSLKPSTLRVLHALHAAGDRGATTHSLCQPDVGGVRFGGRIYELRELGLRIDVQQERPGSYRYWLRENAASARLLPTAELRKMPPEQVNFSAHTAGPRRANDRPHGTEGEASMQDKPTRFKTCAKCGVCKPAQYFSPARTNRDGLQSSRPCRASRERELYGNRNRVLRRYGLEPGEYDRLVACGCAICGAAERIVVDDHATGLCTRCNSAIGLLKDPSLMRAAASYIERHGGGS